MCFIPLEARDRDASCASCGRQGTYAAVAREAECDVIASRNVEHHVAFGPASAPLRMARYCRRCWAPAQRQLHKEQKAARAQADAAFIAWVRAGEPTAGAAPDRTGIGAMVVAFHWSLAPGTWWRELRRSSS